MTPDMSAQIEPKTEGTMKAVLLKGTVRMVSARLGKEIDTTEQQAIGFVVDRNWNGQQDPIALLRNTFSVPDEASARDVAWTLNTKIFEANMIEANRRMSEATNNVGELKKLQGIKRVLDIQHNSATARHDREPNAVVHLGGVPEYWLPEWVKSYK